MASTKMLLLLLSMALLALSSAQDVNDGKRGKGGIVQGMAGLKFNISLITWASAHRLRGVTFAGFRYMDCQLFTLCETHLLN